MSSRLTQCWNALGEQTAFVPFIMAGHPHPDVTVDLLHALVKSGADVIELGVPFSDPMADGPTIEAAGHVALSHGVSLAKVLSLVAEFRQTNGTTPIILMGYYNPIYRFGAEAFAQEAAKAGVDGCIVVDLPPEEMDELAPHLDAASIAPIMLATPTSDAERLEKMRTYAKGHLYYVAVTGVTGSASADYSKLADQLTELRKVIDLPVTVGFGIKTPEDAKIVAALTEGVVVGSALVKVIDANKDQPTATLCEAVSTFSASLASACK